jgi:hypothetical protein
MQRVQHARNLSGARSRSGASARVPRCRFCNRRLEPGRNDLACLRLLLLAPASLHAAFDSAREREKASWTNELPYPIDAEISS